MQLSHLAKWLYVDHPTAGRANLCKSFKIRFLTAALSKEERYRFTSSWVYRGGSSKEKINPAEIFVRAIRDVRGRLITAQSLIHRPPITEEVLSAVSEGEIFGQQ